MITITSNDETKPQEVVSIHSAVITDADGDGSDNLDAGGDDCNDNDPDIYPGAEDEWYDGIDANCDGADDYDQDGDGFQTLVWNEDVNLVAETAMPILHASRRTRCVV